MAHTFTSNLLNFPHSLELTRTADCKCLLHLQKNYMLTTPERKWNNVRKSVEKKYATMAAIDSTKSVSGGKAVEIPAVVVLKATVVIKKKNSPSLSQVLFGGTDPLVAVNNLISSGVDGFSDTFCQRISLQLVSTDIDPDTGVGKRNQESTFGNWLQKASMSADKVQYVTQLVVSEDFGRPGAIVVVNKHQNEFFLETVTIEGLKSGRVFFPCHSWVHPLVNNAVQRVFFANQVYLPSATPKGLLDLRRGELKALQGDGKGVRKAHERVYDYDVYNDLGNPDKSKDLERPLLGGSKEKPYPRRCRTGRPHSITDPRMESRLSAKQKVYVPLDEDFEQIKAASFLPGKIKGILHALVPALVSHFKETVDDFHSFDEIDKLYYEGIHLNTPSQLIKTTTFWDKLYISQVVKRLTDSRSYINHLIQYPLPEMLKNDKFGWMWNSQFGRQFLAGVNPCKIELLKVFPPVSKIDQRPSSFRAEHLTPYLGGLSIEKAIEEKRLFIVDYYDVFIPFVGKINALEGHKTYATRTIFILNASGILTPIAIELSLPSSTSKSVSSNKVLTPAEDGTGIWLWNLAKAHVSSNHIGYQQLVAHWLHTHACTEPYVIATHRQLSVLHPVAKLLHPHLRYTMEINAIARQNLISADGIIEKCFTPGRYAMEMSSAAYGQYWQFNHESLPADLLRRGMAVEDESAPHGLRLVVEDYPYAADGLLIWSAIKSWVKDYLSIYYTHPETINNDSELQQWWTEIRTKGHADKMEASWWPKLQTVNDLTEILTTIIWVVSGQHAAVNFGQFLHAGYTPNLPSMTRQLIPDEKHPEFNDFILNPQRFFLATLPSKVQSTTVMAVLETLSTHSHDEEYLGHRVDTDWTSDIAAKEALEKFGAQLKVIENTIHERNNNPHLRNRYGAGIHPYQLLLPHSGPGVTSRGIPNSVSI